MANKNKKIKRPVIYPHVKDFKKCNLICLDLGRRTGWLTYQASSKTVESGVYELFSNNKKEQAIIEEYNEGKRFKALRDFLTDQYVSFENNNNTILGFENVNPRVFMGADQVRQNLGYRATAMGWAEDMEIIAVPIPVPTIKKALTGSGNAKKAQMIDAARDCGFLPFDENEADAIGVYYALLDIYKTANNEKKL